MRGLTWNWCSGMCITHAAEYSSWSTAVSEKHALEEWLKLALGPAAAMFCWEVLSNSAVVPGAEVLEHLGKEGGKLVNSADIPVLEAQCFSCYSTLWLHYSLQGEWDRSGIQCPLDGSWVQQKEIACMLGSSCTWIRLGITSNYHLG